MIQPSAAEATVLAATIILLLAAGLALYVLRLRRMTRRLGDDAVIRQLLGIDIARTPAFRLVLVTAAAVLLGFAIVSAAEEGGPSPVRGPVVLLLDASGSMLVEDVGRPRLEGQRDVAYSLLRAIPEVPVGVVTFAGRAFSLTPPTRDRSAVEMYLAAVDPTIVTQTGSAMGAAIRQGIGLLATAAGGRGTLILISDGDETDDREAAIEAAATARQNGVRIHTVAVGTPNGGPVPALDLTTGVASGYLLDQSGGPLVSRADDALLAEIARRAGGVSLRWDDAGAAQSLAELVGDASTAPEDRAHLPLHVWLSIGALVLLALEPVADPLRRRR